MHTIPHCQVRTYNHLVSRQDISWIFKGNKAAGVLACIVQNYLIYQMLLSVHLLHFQSLCCNLRLRVLHKGTMVIVPRPSFVGLRHTTFWLPSLMILGYFPTIVLYCPAIYQCTLLGEPPWSNLRLKYPAQWHSGDSSHAPSNH